MVYDGDCGFCKYWLVKWKKISKNAFDFEPYQSAATKFKDIPVQEFSKAVQLILLDGKVLAGAEAAYYTYYVNNRMPILYKWYTKIRLFRFLSDQLYRLIAKNRNSAFKLTKLVFGSDPRSNSTFRFLFVLLTVLLLFTLVFLSIANT